MASAQTTNSKKNRDPRFDNLIGPTDPKIDAEARTKIITARVRMLMKEAFFGNLVTQLELVNADEWCATAATDGRRLYYNSRFIMMLDADELVFLFAHELLHVVYDHFSRRVDRDAKLWNIAGDYAINADLKRAKIGTFITTVPALYDVKYDGMSTENIYDDLYENADKISIDDLLDQLLDDHMNGEDAEGGRPQISDSEREEIKQEMKQKIVSAAQSAANGGGAGNIPDGVKQIIKQITEPVMPWPELIDANVTSIIRHDYSYMRPSRRSWHTDAILPGMIPGEEVDLAIALDVSGSISDEATTFLTEVQGIMQSFTGYRLHVFCFDTEIYNPVDFTSDNLEDIADYVPQGGGGTSFECIFDYLKTRGADTKRLIVFTDGYPFGSWGDANFCDTTWIIHGNTTVEPPFGTWAYFSDPRIKSAGGSVASTVKPGRRRRK
jgi:predicted metal-dependent peptidase